MYEVLTKMIDGYENTWTTENEKGERVLQWFDTLEDAEQALNEHIDDTNTAYASGNLASPYEDGDCVISFFDGMTPERGEKILEKLNMHMAHLGIEMLIESSLAETMLVGNVQMGMFYSEIFDLIEQETSEDNDDEDFSYFVSYRACLEECYKYAKKRGIDMSLLPSLDMDYPRTRVQFKVSFRLQMPYVTINVYAEDENEARRKVEDIYESEGRQALFEQADRDEGTITEDEYSIQINVKNIERIF